MKLPLAGPGRTPIGEEYADLAGEPPPDLGRIYWTQRIDRLGAGDRAHMVSDIEPFASADAARFLTFFETGVPQTVQPPFQGPKQPKAVFPFVGRLQLPRDGRRAQLLDLLGVERIVTATPHWWLDRRYERIAEADGTVVYRNPHALPRAYRVARARPAPPTLSRTLQRLASPRFDVGEVALVDPLPETLAGAEGRPAGGETEIVRYEPEHVIIRTQGDAPGLVVLSDLYYPGWQATVDGETVPILQANGVFRAVAVPAGTSTVTFRYRPASFIAGWALAAVAAMGLGGALVFERRPLLRFGGSIAR
jgi:hypothetical protein